MGSFFLAAFLVLQGPAPNGGIAQDPSPVLQAAQQPAPAPQAAVTRPKRSPGKIALDNFWSDQKAIWTSPLRMNRKDAVWWAVFGGSTAALIATDSGPSNILPTTSRRITISRNVSRIGAPYTTLPIAGALYIYGRIHKDDRIKETGALGTEALLDSYLAVSLLKVAAGRERPDLPGGDGRFFKGKNGFPSGHAMMSWSLASVIAHEYRDQKVLPVIAYSLASAVSVSRVVQQKHFPSDAVAGGAMGWFVGRYVFQHHSNSNNQNGTGSRVRNRYVPGLYPSVEPLSRTYGLALAWNP